MAAVLCVSHECEFTVTRKKAPVSLINSLINPYDIIKLDGTNYLQQRLLDGIFCAV